MHELINNLVSEARALNCSETIINNLLIAGDFNSMCALEEHLEETKQYLAREQERQGYINYNAISSEASRLAVKELGL